MCFGWLLFFTPCVLRASEVEFDLQLCNEEITEAVYSIDSPPDCSNVSASNTFTYNVDVYFPQPAAWNIAATSCSIKTVVVRFWWNSLYGEIREPISTTFTPVHPARCREWKRTLADDTLGILRTDKSNPTFFSTQNPIIPVFNWPYATDVTTSNAEMSMTHLQFSGNTGVGRHFIEYVGDCSALTGHCKSEKRTFIFDKFQFHCRYPGRQPLLGKQLQVHVNANGNYYVVRDSNLAFGALFECPDKVKECFKNMSFVLCSNSHFILVSKEESAHPFTLSEKLWSTTDKTKVFSKGSAISDIVAQSIESVAINADNEIRSLRDQLLKLQCVQLRTTATNLRATQHILPSETLSLLLNREVKAVAGAYTLHELHCVTVKAIIYPSLMFKGQFLSSPVFHVIYMGTSHWTQLSRENFLRFGVTEFKSPSMGRLFFTVGDRVVNFLNGTLVNDTMLVKKLNLPGMGVPIELEPVQLDTVQLSETIANYTLESWSIGSLRATVQRLVATTAHQFAAKGIKLKSTVSLLKKGLEISKIKGFFENVVNKFSPSNWINWTRVSSVMIFVIVGSVAIVYCIALVVGLVRRLGNQVVETSV